MVMGLVSIFPRCESARCSDKYHVGVILLYVSVGWGAWVICWWLVVYLVTLWVELDFKRKGQAQPMLPPRPMLPRRPMLRHTLQLCNQRFSVYLPIEIVQYIVQFEME